MLILPAEQRVRGMFLPVEERILPHGPFSSTMGSVEASVAQARQPAAQQSFWRTGLGCDDGREGYVSFGSGQNGILPGRKDTRTCFKPHEVFEAGL